MLGEKAISKVFLELTAQNVDKFYCFILPNIICNQTRNTIRDGWQVAVEKNQDLKGK